MVGMKNATLMLYRVKRGPNEGVPALRQYIPAAIMAAPATRWQRESTFWAWILRSASMPMRVGMKMETIPCMAKNHFIWLPSPMLPR